MFSTVVVSQVLWYSLDSAAFRTTLPLLSVAEIVIFAFRRVKLHRSI